MEVAPARLLTGRRSIVQIVIRRGAYILFLLRGARWATKTWSITTRFVTIRDQSDPGRWTHACHRQQSTDQSENRYSRLVFLASFSTIFAPISVVSENARESPLVRG
jgi:hypothetical protein